MRLLTGISLGEPHADEVNYGCEAIAIKVAPIVVAITGTCSIPVGYNTQSSARWQSVDSVSVPVGPMNLGNS